jgi:hypothetical protein
MHILFCLLEGEILMEILQRYLTRFQKELVINGGEMQIGMCEYARMPQRPSIMHGTSQSRSKRGSCEIILLE